jgi:hypothetical protein
MAIMFYIFPLTVDADPQLLAYNANEGPRPCILQCHRLMMTVTQFIRADLLKEFKGDRLGSIK